MSAASAPSSAAGSSEAPRRPVVLFLWSWLQIGFVSGTLTLLGPVRWISDRAEAAGWSQGAEDLWVRGVVGAFVLASAAVAVLATRALGRLDVRGRVVGLGLLALLAGATVWLWMTPAAMSTFQTAVVTSEGRFTFGPYPDKARLEALERQGYRGVVSLLHPAVVPFEPKLLADERRAAAEVGIELIHAPMLPWVSDNSGSLERIRQLAESGTGRYYVHCYLGRDRVSVVKGFLSSVHASGVVPGAGERGEIQQVTAFARGPVYQLDDGVFMTPYPSDEELLKFFQWGNVQHVLSLLDPDRPEDVPWIDKEAAALRPVGVGMTLRPVPWDPYRPSQLASAVAAARELQRPLAIHGFRADGPVWEAFLLGWETGLPPLPPSLFQEPMRGGRPHLVGVNVAAGPAPMPDEFGSYLARRGIRELAYVGQAARPDARQDARVAAQVGLRWHEVAAGAEGLIELVSTGGPWYVYGPGLGAVQGALDDALQDPEAILERFSRPASGPVASDAP